MGIVQRVWCGASASLLLVACGAGESGEMLGHDELALTAPTAVGGFAVLASGHASFKDRSTVSGGHIGVAPGSGDSVTAGFDSRVAIGKSTLGQRLVLKDRAGLGDLFRTTLAAGSGATFTSLSPYAAPPAQPPIVAFTAGTGTLTVSTPTTLAAGSYGNVTVNSTLTLSGGTYQLANLTLNANTVVQASAPSILRVAGKITGSNHVRLAPTGTQGAGALRIVVAGATDAAGGIVLGTDSTLTALVVSRASVTINDRLIGTGAIAGRDVTLGFDSRFTFAVGFGCNADSACGDGNECTADACVDAQCVHTVVANGNECSDDGNQCTADRCTGGSCTHPAAASGSACGDHGACDGAGVCVPPECLTDTECDDDDPCTTETCVNNHCSHGSAPAGTTCGHDGQCDGAGHCAEPECTTAADCNDGLECTDDACTNGTCAHDPKPAHTSCAHGGVCDGTGLCVNCAGAEECNDGLECTTDSCVNKLCAHEPLPSGQSCAHGGLCDGAGLCLSPCTTEDDCNDGLECTDDFCNSNGACSHESKPAHTSCAHGGVCDGAGLCVNCAGAEECDDGLECTIDLCPDSTCSHEPKPAGTPCAHGGTCDDTGLCL